MSLISKMLRIAGRSITGKARAIKVSEEGELHTQLSGSKEFNIFESQSTVGSSLNHDIEGYISAVIVVSGDFEGELYFAGISGPSKRTTLKKMVKGSEGKYLVDGLITEKGTYYLDVSGFREIMSRMSRIESGSATVDVHLNAQPSSVFEYGNQKRNVEIKRKTITIDSGEYKELQRFSVNDFVMVYATVYAKGGAHKFDVDFLFRTSIESESPNFSISQTDPILVLGGNDKATLRGASEWIEVKGSTLSPHIRNRADTEETYDIVFYGVR